MILIVDFGSQTAHLIGRRLRQLGIKSTYINPADALLSAKKPEIKGIILSGGPANISESPSLTVSPELFKLNIPVLGICYGWQLIAHLLGGSIKASKKEYGPEKISIVGKNSLFTLPKKHFTAIMSHGDTVIKLPKGFKQMGYTKQVDYAAVANEKEATYGVQVHPEAYHTQQGLEILKNFAVKCH